MLNAHRVRALVVGGGTVGARRALALAAAGAEVRVVAPAAADALRDAAATAALRLTLDARRFVADDVAAAHVVVAATDRPDVNALVADAAEARGTLCNLADDPERSSYWTAAVHRAGPLVVAVSAGGVPAAAARVRDAIGARLDARYAEAVHGLAALRARLLAEGGTERWRAAADELIGDDFVGSVEAGTFADRVERWG